MPSWCENRVTFYTPVSKELQKIKTIFSNDRPFHQIIPEPDWSKIPAPEDLQDSAGNPLAKKGELPVVSQDNFFNLEWPSSKRADSRWHSWRTTHWGCKWEIKKDEIDWLDDEDEEICIIFATAWCPAEGICDALRENFENLEVTWFFDEPGAQIAGYL